MEIINTIKAKQESDDNNNIVKYKNLDVVSSQKLPINRTKLNIKKPKNKTIILNSPAEQSAFNIAEKYILKRDKNLPCISCNTLVSEKWRAKHIFNPDVYKGVMLNEFNLNRVCNYCYNLDDIFEKQKQGFIDRYGNTSFRALESLANSSKQYVWSEQSLSERQSYFASKMNKNSIKD